MRDKAAAMKAVGDWTYDVYILRSRASIN